MLRDSGSRGKGEFNRILPCINIFIEISTLELFDHHSSHWVASASGNTVSKIWKKLKRVLTERRKWRLTHRTLEADEVFEHGWEIQSGSGWYLDIDVWSLNMAVIQQRIFLHSLKPLWAKAMLHRCYSVLSSGLQGSWILW